jgi:hypothetical protein
MLCFIVSLTNAYLEWHSLTRLISLKARHIENKNDKMRTGARNQTPKKSVKKKRDRSAAVLQFWRLAYDSRTFKQQ